MAGEKILLVEGNATRARGVCLILEKLGGYKLVHAPTVDEAIRDLKAGSFDLIITNITIVRLLDGVKLVQLVLMRRVDSHRAPVMILTSQKNVEVVRECVRAGVVDYMVSYAPEELLGRIRKVLAEHRGLNEDQLREGIIQALEKILGLPTISAVHVRLQQLLRSDETSAEDVAKIVALDQSLTANVLKLSNSALFGFTRKILSIKDAVALLGFKAVQVAVAAVSTFEALGRIEEKKFHRAAFWEHAIGCGAIARVLAGKLKMDQDHALGAAILHDIGKVVLDGYFPNYFARALDAASERGIPIFQAEQEALPVTHEEVGRHLAERWNLPEPLVEVIGAHNSLSIQNPKHAELVSLIHVADARCRQLKVGRAGDDAVWEPKPEALEHLGITVAALDDWESEIKQEVEKAESVLDLV